MRHIEKLKKIFAACGKECSADTNGAALDELLTLAENGELGGGGGGTIPSTGFALIKSFDESYGEIIKDGTRLTWSDSNDIKIKMTYGGTEYTKSLESQNGYYIATINNFKICVLNKSDVLPTPSPTILINLTSGFDITKLSDLEIFMD